MRCNAAAQVPLLRPPPCSSVAAPTGSLKLPVVKLVDDFSASFSVVANDGPTFYFSTNLNAPRYR